MGDEALKGQMLDMLEQCGLVGKKLAVFDVSHSLDIASQLCRDLGVICEQWHVDTVSCWITDARRGEPLAKRLRGEHDWNPLHSTFLEDRKQMETNTSASFSFPAVSPEGQLQTRPTRRRLYDVEEEGARAKRESDQKELWSRELYMELKKFNAPALEHLEHCVPDKHLHLALAGRTRYNTLKRYIKTWKSFMQWLTATKGVQDYPEPGDLVEYLFTRYDEPCGPTIPGLIVKAVTWMERTAEGDVRGRIGESHVVASVRDYIVDMLSKDAPPTKRAPRYPAVFIESMEAMVEDETLRIGIRLVAWIKLVKIWGSLRWDDIQKINPRELKYYSGRMTTILRVTKTTGPTKRVQELPVCISEHAYIATPFWLKTGFDLFKREANFERDYMLPKFDMDMSRCRRVMAGYNDVSSYSALVRRKAMRPGSDVQLIDPILASFWTEHSERATLPTGLALLRAAREERDMLGRWKPDGSDTYLRMYNGVVARLQLQFARAARKDDRSSMLDERDVVESATSWLTDRCDPLDDKTMEAVLHHLEQSLKWQARSGWEIAGEPELPSEGLCGFGRGLAGEKPCVSSRDQRDQTAPLRGGEQRQPLQEAAQEQGAVGWGVR